MTPDEAYIRLIAREEAEAVYQRRDLDRHHRKMEARTNQRWRDVVAKLEAENADLRATVRTLRSGCADTTRAPAGGSPPIRAEVDAALASREDRTPSSFQDEAR